MLGISGRCRFVLATAMLAGAGAALSSGSAPATVRPDPIYTALRAARPEGEAFTVSRLALERDAYRFVFESGTFQFLTPVGDRTPGAVFVGAGSVSLSPANPWERRQIALQRGDPKLETLSERFDELVLLFSDATAAEIRKGAAPGAASPRAGAAFERFLKLQRKELKTNLHLRLLRDWVKPEARASGLFLAGFDGKDLPAAIAVVDPAGLDWLAGDLGREDSALLVVSGEDRGFWYLAERRGVGARAEAMRREARARSYAVETAIAKNGRIAGTTTIGVDVLEEGLRVLPLHLLGKLRIRSVEFSQAGAESWAPASFVQESEKEDDDAGVVFPAPLPAAALRVRVAYEGKDVLENAGDGNFFVGARESWYPNLGVFREPVPYTLTYRHPKGYEVVSVGRLVESKEDGDGRMSVWKTEKPVRVAGFNYGRFKKLETSDRDSGVTVSVYTNPGTPDFIREINAILANRPDAGLQHVGIDTKGVASSAMADGINTARVGSVYFGPLAEPRVAITQQTQAFFGQSWPSLIYLPYVAALDGTQRHELGLRGISDFVDLVGPHEFAHQWWGHLVGWGSYRDQWLSEGFAEFTAALVLQRTMPGRKFHDFWERTRRRILEKPRGSSLANDAAGPMTQGWRLATRRSPEAYSAMVYEKGAFVLHMLRMMMLDRGDATFIAMMKDFASTWANRNPSTSDFQAVVERHMTPRMDLTKDGKMDWFFDEWIRGTEIPRYEGKLAAAPAGEGGYRITGTIRQEGVSERFRMLVPIEAEFGKGEFARLGAVALTGTTSFDVDITIKLPKPPRRVLVNSLLDVLARD